MAHEVRVVSVALKLPNRQDGARHVGDVETDLQRLPVEGAEFHLLLTVELQRAAVGDDGARLCSHRS
eukprot:16153091-Heterocapsa_arctica.AAC.1